METTTRKYKNKSSMGKITIKHYLYEPKGKNNDKKLTINVLLTINRKVTTFKSKIYYGSSFKIDDNELLKSLIYSEAIKRDTELILHIVNELNPFSKESFDIKEVYKIYSNPRWNLQTAINDYLFFEMLNTDDSLRVPMKNFTIPISLFQFLNDKLKQEIGEKYKSKIWFIDTIIWGLTFHCNPNGFKVFAPTILDFKCNKFQESIFSVDFEMLKHEDKIMLIDDINKLLKKNNDNFLK